MKAALVSCLMFLSSPATALSDAELAKGALEALGWTQKFPTVESRREAALLMKSYWRDFGSQLPRLSPQEREWVAQEIGADNIERSSRAMKTPEFALLKIENTVNACNSALDNLLSTLQADADAKLRNAEMFFWSRVAACYFDSEQSLGSYMSQARLVNSEGLNNFEYGFQFDDFVLGRILNGALPASMADTMNWELFQD